MVQWYIVVKNRLNRLVVLMWFSGSTPYRVEPRTTCTVPRSDCRTIEIDSVFSLAPGSGFALAR